MEEPSVLDYIKSLLDPRRPRLQIPWDDPIAEPSDGDLSLLDLGEPADEESITLLETETVPERVPTPITREEPTFAEERVPAPVIAPTLPETVPPVRWPLLSFWALVLALFGQRIMEPPGRDWGMGVGLYLLGVVVLVGAYFRKEWQLAPFPLVRTERDPLTVQQTLLIAAGLLSGAAFFTFAGNRFTRINLTLWLASFGCLIGGLWLPARSLQHTVRAWGGKVRAWLARPQLNIHLTPWTLLVIVVFLFSAFYRYYRIDTVPPEMISDHAEKLLDVKDVLDGRYSIFFERNTGREPFQFYLTALAAIVFNTGISFMSLKLGTATAGMVTLIYMYKLGVEIGNRRVGLLAAAFTGIAYWPNVISRIALRFALYPLFAAPALYYLIRGVRRQSRNDFILAGIALGLGLHGYSSFRAVPVLVVIAAGLFVLHQFSVLQKPWFWIGFSSTVVVSVVIFMPLLRYITETPEQRIAFSYRLMTRISTIENPLPDPAGQIFLKNLGRGLAMFGWDDGETWPHSVTHRPALDVVSAVLFHLGVVLMLVRYVQKRDWLDIFLLVSIPVLMLPSIISLTFPGENPSLNRPAGAYVPVFLILALSLDGLMRALEKGWHGKRGTQFAWGLALLLFFWASSQNFDLVFRQYYRSYQLSSWNTTELGRVIRGYIDSGIGDENSLWIVGYPHWVDTRLASIIAGYPYMDFGVIPEEMLIRSEGYTGPKMFLLHPQAFDSLQTLQTVYPGGILTPYESKVETKDFWIYFVPSTISANQAIP